MVNGNAAVSDLSTNSKWHFSPASKMWTRLSSLTLKPNLASRALSKVKSYPFIAFLSSLELVLPETIKKRAETPKNMGKTLNYFPYLAVEVVGNLTYCFSVK